MGLEDSVNSQHSINLGPNTLERRWKIDSVEQFIVNELPGILPIITDKISIIVTVKEAFALLYCTQYDTKIESMHLSDPFDFHRSWNSNIMDKWDWWCSVY
jgi:hypothetical protein